MKKVKVGELVVDFSIYPRSDVDSQHITYMAEALDAGVHFPPIVIEKGSNRIVDGVHRTRMFKSRCGDDYEVEVIEKTYKNEPALLLDAIRLNAGHGRTLTMHDRTHCILLAAKMEVPEDELASALCMTVEKVGALRVDRIGTLHVGQTTRSIPLKRTIRHMAGKSLTKGQSEANDRLSGMNQVFYVNQVILLIESKLLNMDDEKLLERLGILASLLKKLPSLRKRAAS
jgi:hypothetical protein